MSSITLIKTAQEIAQMQTYYQAYLVNAVPYSQFRAKINNVTITAYTSGKVLFQGNNAIDEAQKWQKDTMTATKKTSKTVSNNENELIQSLQQATIIGSDEVGNGSYFGSLTVCAVYLPVEQHALVKELGARDSKLLSDKQITSIANDLKHTVKYHLTNCNPIRYNKMNQTMNANQIKAVLHNETLQALIEQLSDEEKHKMDSVLIDQFAPAKNYHQYLKNEPHPYKGKIHFIKKAESHHLAVACASIIARAAFVESLTYLGKIYNQKLPSGAGRNVDLVAAELINEYSEKALFKTAKLHFANTNKAKALANSNK